MSDKDFLVVISEMLRKQDRQAEIMSSLNIGFNNFVEISVQEFDLQRKQQQQFNTQFLNLLEKLNENLVDTKDQQKQFNDRFSDSVDQQKIFNQSFLNKLDDIETALKK